MGRVAGIPDLSKYIDEDIIVHMFRKLEERLYGGLNYELR